MPVLRAAAMPLRGFCSSLTSLKSRAIDATMSLVPSVEPSSTTTMSRSTLSRSTSSERIAASMKRAAFSAGMMTLTGMDCLPLQK